MTSPLQLLRPRLGDPGFAIAPPDGFEAPPLRARRAPRRHRAQHARRHRCGLSREVQVILINLGSEPFIVTRGMRVVVIAPVARAGVTEVATLEDTARGAGGFGSTGG